MTRVSTISTLASVLLALTVSQSWADDPLTPVEKFNCEDHFAGSIAGKKYLSSTFTWENDSFGPDSDEWYTNGMRLRFTNNPLCNTSTLLEDGFRSALGFEKFNLGKPEIGNDLLTTGWSFGMNMYTPREITYSGPQPNDRPWTGWLYYGQHLALHKNYLNKPFQGPESIHTLEAQVGVLGEWSKQKEIQTAWHILVDAPNPEGWDHQQSGKVGYNLYYSFNKPISGNLNPYMKGGSASWRAGVALGNVLRTANLGLTAHWNFLGLSPSEVRDSYASVGNVDLPGGIAIPSLIGVNFPEEHDIKDQKSKNGTVPQTTIWEKKKQSRREWRKQAIFGLFANVDARYVSYSNFLEGTDIDTLPLVYDIEGGIKGKFKNHHMIYMLSFLYRSPEFETSQGDKADSNIVTRITISWVWDSIVY